ncbi:DUF6252 family protein [Altibacter sp. HG106]|uniref:DUF6252 family protein n=1 Tax=Altibacter sp. HG106 TaxID=3023937 RepID=UPI002350FF80|nr:DUF6252 family protein [Altibacter sp. HG106]MDC7995286.1 DUF6252 family protein [Altibacter sp. HG106]
MRTYLLLFVLVGLPFLSCSEDDERIDTPMFARNFEKNYFFVADSLSATKNADSSYTIRGLADQGIIEITVSSPTVNRYNFGKDSENVATYTNVSGSVFTTDHPQGVGYVEITRWNSAGQTLSGVFDFTAVIGASGTNKNRFNYGEFTNARYPQEEPVDDDDPADTGD